MNKSLLLTGVLFLFFTAKTFAQPYTGTATLNITLSDVLSMTVTQPLALDVNFHTEAEYTSGIVANAPDHINVVSSRGFVVKAIAGTISGTAAIAAGAGSVKISTAIGSGNTGNTTGITYASALALPTTGGTALAVITSTKSSWSGANSTNKFNVSYNIGSGAEFAGKDPGVNAIPVIYTVTQP